MAKSASPQSLRIREVSATTNKHIWQGSGARCTDLLFGVVVVVVVVAMLVVVVAEVIVVVVPVTVVVRLCARSHGGTCGANPSLSHGRALRDAEREVCPSVANAVKFETEAFCKNGFMKLHSSCPGM